MFNRGSCSGFIIYPSLHFTVALSSAMLKYHVLIKKMFPRKLLPTTLTKANKGEECDNQMNYNELDIQPNSGLTPESE